MCISANISIVREIVKLRVRRVVIINYYNFRSSISGQKHHVEIVGRLLTDGF